MSKLLLHPTTEYQYRALKEAQTHTVLITGITGSGKETLARTLAKELLDITKSENNPYILELSPENGTIGVEAVRQIRDFLKRKTTGNNSLRRAIIIINAQTMTDEAQNALLKTLEEPPEDTVIILTSDQLTNVKQTIRSRTQQLLVLPVDQAMANSFFIEHDPKELEKAFYMSDGRVGLLTSLLDMNQEHELVQGISEAKRLLRLPVYERLLEIESLSKQKGELSMLLEGLERVLTSLLRQSAHKKQESAVRKAYLANTRVQKAKQALLASGNAKLLLTDLFLNI